MENQFASQRFMHFLLKRIGHFFSYFNKTCASTGAIDYKNKKVG
jgi:hypothetical protein